MPSPSDYILVALIIALQSAKNKKGEIPSDFDDLGSLFYETYGASASNEGLSLALGRLEAVGMARVMRDAYAGDLVHFKNTLFAATPAELSKIVDPQVLNAVAVGGDSFFQRVFQNQQFWKNFEVEISVGPQDVSNIEDIEFKAIVPAADRFVSRTDNIGAVQDIDLNLIELSELISSQDNEVGDKIGEERELINREIEIAKIIVSEPKFRLAGLVGWLAPVLRFLADKFAGGAIADSAKRLLELILTLV